MVLRLPTLVVAIVFVGATGAWRSSAHPVVTAAVSSATHRGSTVRLPFPATQDAFGTSARGTESPIVLTLVGAGFALIARAARRRNGS